MRKINFRSGGFIILAASVATVLVLGIGVWASNNNSNNVTSYEECVAQKDAVIQESYPATCIFDGQEFTQSVDDASLDSRPTSQDAATESDSTESSEAAAPVGFLVITEWGVKLPLTQSIADAAYTAPVNGESSSATVGLSTKAVIAGSPECTSLYSITRVPSTQNLSGDQFGSFASRTLLANIDGYLYLGATAQDSCGNVDAEDYEAAAASQQETVTQLEAAALSLQKN